jgi:uncharacterized protein with HEPN domain
MKDKLLDSQKRLEHILEAIITIEKFSEKEDSVSFCKNEMLNNSVLLQFIIIGEAIIHVEDEILEKYDYPWYKVRSFRNMIAHEYFNIKLPAVWEIIQKNLPELKAILQQILTK